MQGRKKDPDSHDPTKVVLAINRNGYVHLYVKGTQTPIVSSSKHRHDAQAWALREAKARGLTLLPNKYWDGSIPGEAEKPARDEGKKPVQDDTETKWMALDGAGVVRMHGVGTRKEVEDFHPDVKKMGYTLWIKLC